MDRNRFLVGAYYLTANLHDDKHVQEVADAGIDFLVAVDGKTNLLDLCAKHGIGVVAHARFPLGWGGDGKNAGKYAETMPLEKLDAALAKCGRHPALWGDYPVDEPNARDFAHVDAVVKRYEAKFPGQLAFVNLYPIYANPPASSQCCTGYWLAGGEKNVTYDYVRHVDAELHGLSDVFMRWSTRRIRGTPVRPSMST